MGRRTLLAIAPALALAGRVRADTADFATPDFAAIERACGGKLGVCVIDTGSTRTLAWRADSRFPFCSSFKAPLAAFVLWSAERGRLGLDEPIPYADADLVGYAPVTRKHLAEGAMSIRALCAAAVDYSDNGAANLLLRKVGGPAALTDWMRRTGDPAFQLAHYEMALNHAHFGDATDTTTPRAMAESFRRFALGDVLNPASRAQFVDWLVANTTGDMRLRAGLPAGWRVGDKTGTWNEGWFSTVDIAVAWPPGRAPLVIAGFVTDHRSTEAGETALAEVARLAAAWAEKPRG
jgi:beta-lactamase class A